MWFLVLVLLAHPADNPQFVSVFTTRDACLVAAAKANGLQPELNNVPRNDGRIGVCFAIVYPS